MADKTNIEWTDASWTPVRARSAETGKIGWHCEKVTAGCDNCYAASMNMRLGTHRPFKPGHHRNGDLSLFLDQKMLMQPLRWRKPRMIFVCSMTDLFADFVPDEWIDQVFAVMALAPQHTYQVLTKRPARMRAYFARHDDGFMPAETRIEHRAKRIARERGAPIPVGKTLLGTMPFPHVWLGTSAEDQKTADQRIPHLLDTPAAVRFVSAEPLLRPIDITPYLFLISHDDECAINNGVTEIPMHEFLPENEISQHRIDWIIVGGESGTGARNMDPDWARSIRDQCADAGVSFFMKQMTRKAPIPADLLIRQMPGGLRD